MKDSYYPAVLCLGIMRSEVAAERERKGQRRISASRNEERVTQRNGVSKEGARDERLTSLTILSLGTTSLDLCTCQSHRGGCALVCALVPRARLLRAATAASNVERERTALANEPDG